MIEETKELIQKDITDLEEKADQIKSVLADLKVQLYAKFGNNINLEAADEWLNVVMFIFKI